MLLWMLKSKTLKEVNSTVTNLGAGENTQPSDMFRANPNPHPPSTQIGGFKWKQKTPQSNLFYFHAVIGISKGMLGTRLSLNPISFI